MFMKQSYLRVNRMFHLDNPHTGYRGWYFEVRDGSPRGPYASLKLADIALEMYLNSVAKTQDSGPRRAIDVRIERLAGLQARTTTPRKHQCKVLDQSR